MLASLMFWIDFSRVVSWVVICCRQCCWEQDQHSTSRTCSAEAKEWRMSERWVPEEEEEEEEEEGERSQEEEEEEGEEERGRAMSMKAEFWMGRG